MQIILASIIIIIALCLAFAQGMLFERAYTIIDNGYNNTVVIHKGRCKK